MGLLDRARKLAEQAKEKAEEALSEVRSRAEQASRAQDEPAPGAPRGEPDGRLGTPYVPGMLGAPGWREQGLVDPAALLPIDDRDQAGIPHSTKSEILEEPFGMGRRWTSGDRSAGVFYRLTAAHRAWAPPGPATPVPDVDDATEATLDDGRTLVMIPADDRQIVVELRGFDGPTRHHLAAVAADMLYDTA